MLFSAPMVRAMLAGKKTVTRRLVNPRLHLIVDGDEDTGRVVEQSADEFGARVSELAKSPYGVSGDRLWVREAWKYGGQSYDGPTFRYRADAASYVKGWKPSIHMPRAASRITLEITDVRVERLQDITDDEIEAEGVGISPDGDSAYYEEKNGGGGKLPILAAWEHLWDSINGARAPWASNPWVWRIAFRRLP